MNSPLFVLILLGERKETSVTGVHAPSDSAGLELTPIEDLGITELCRFSVEEAPQPVSTAVRESMDMRVMLFFIRV